MIHVNTSSLVGIDGRETSIPIGWLSSEPVETASFQKWRRSRGVIFGGK